MIKFRQLAAVFTMSALFSTTSITHAATLNVPASFSSIQDAIDSARNGDTVRVTGGTYDESLLISKRIRLRGRSNPTLNGSIDVQANRVSITGFTIRAIGDDGGFGIRLGGNRGTVNRNVIDILNPDDDDGFGVLVIGDRNTVERNVAQGGSRVIQVNRGSDNNEIVNNRVQSGDDSGIQIQGNYNLVEDNEAIRTGGAEGPGFDIEGIGHRIIDNLSLDNGGSGFSIRGSGHVVSGNDADENDEFGFGVSATDSIFNDLNQASDNMRGFDISGNNNIFDNNEANDNEMAGWLITGSDNTFIGNGADNNDTGMEIEFFSGSLNGNDFQFNECKDNRVSAIPSTLCEDTTR